MISTKTSEEAQAEEKSQNQILSSTTTNVALEDSAAAAPHEVGGIGSSRMTPYFKQPELPADFKFMEPYIKCNERDWK